MVAVLDAWTSPPGTGAERRNVFSAGETLQFNGLFVTERDVPSRIRILFIIESLSNVVVTEGDHDYDIAFRPQRVLEGEFNVSPAAQRPYARFLIPEVDLRFDWRGRRATTLELARGGFDYIFAPTLYNFRIVVRLLDVATGLEFDLSDGWHYGIAS